MFRKMPFILLVVIGLAMGMNFFLPPFYKSLFYALSLTIKSAIIFILPFLIFGLLFKTAVVIAQKATKMILLILVAVCTSSFLCLLLSYVIGSYTFGLHFSLKMPQEGLALLPAWTISLPKCLSNEHALLLGLTLGILLARCRPQLAERLSGWMERINAKILRGILYTIPLFILGFVIKLDHDRALGYIFENYAWIFTLIVCAIFSYIALMYLVINRLQYRPFAKSMKNIFPAAMAGFGSMSSAACMPLTILGAEKNAQQPHLAKAIIPATVNIHLIGDCFATPIFAFAILNSFVLPEPTFLHYLLFAGYFILAKFSVAAVPGGGILVMLPVLESCFGFNAEMLSLITALYILCDPVITCANVLGNGGFALAMDKFLCRKNKTAQDNFLDS